jgi:hypothetical protein
VKTRILVSALLLSATMVLVAARASAHDSCVAFEATRIRTGPCRIYEFVDFFTSSRS